MKCRFLLSMLPEHNAGSAHPVERSLKLALTAHPIPGEFSGVTSHHASKSTHMTRFSCVTNAFVEENHLSCHSVSVSCLSSVGKEKFTPSHTPPHTHIHRCAFVVVFGRVSGTLFAMIINERRYCFYFAVILLCFGLPRYGIPFVVKLSSFAK